jgi:chromosome segregation and condensation protein ScpB
MLAIIAYHQPVTRRDRGNPRVITSKERWMCCWKPAGFVGGAAQDAANPLTFGTTEAFCRSSA